MDTLTTATQKPGAAIWLLLLALLLKCVSAQAQLAQPTDDAVTLTVQPTGSATQTGQNYAGSQNSSPFDTYDTLGHSDDPSYTTPQLGTYDLNGTSALTITAVAMKGSVSSNNTVVNSTVMRYRVYPLGTSAANKPAYNDVILNSMRPTASSFTGDISAASTPKTLSPINLLDGLTSGGDYVLDIIFYITVTRTVNGVSKTLSFYDLSAAGGPYYLANFYVTPPPTTPIGGTTRWQSTNTGMNGTNWFVAANWSNGIPNATADVVIPESTQGTSIVFPVLNSRSLNYAVHNIKLEGTTNSIRAQLTIENAVLHVYGNISQISGGLIGSVTDAPGIADSTKNSTLILVGDDQLTTGRLSVPDIIVAGSGTKSIANTLLPTNTLSLRPKSILDGVKMRTVEFVNNAYVFSTTGNSIINLATTGIINTEAGSNETITSYIKGIVSVDAPLATRTMQRFGNIGLDFIPNHPATLVTVQRIIDDPLKGPTSATNPNAKPIRRQYFIKGDDNSSSSSTLNSSNTVIFHYLPSAFELDGILESNLMLFSSKGSGTASFTPLYGTLNTTARTVAQDDVPSQAGYYLTLGDRTNPLPVTLVSFSAIRSGDSAKLVWATASEKNNRGFEVQVSADGKTFRTLAFVASQGTNSSTKLDYTYTDTETGKTGVRYYRLHQLDLDGTDSYSPVRVVSFDGGAALASEFSIYPNPVTGDDTRLLIQTAEIGNARLRITDLMGRTIIDQTIATANGSTETKLAALANAKVGTYLAQLTLPSGLIKTIKVQKQ